MKYLGLILMLLIVILFFSNPGQTDFQNYLKKQAVEKVKQETGVEAGVVEGMVGVFTGLFAKAYVRDNYLLFSVYKLGNHKILGIAGQFFPLNKFDESALKEIPEMKKLEELQSKMNQIGEELEKNMNDWNEKNQKQIEEELKKIEERLQVQ